MKEQTFLFGSVTRISPLAGRGFSMAELPKSEWHTGDYVFGKVLPYDSSALVELPSGRLTQPVTGDLFVGALGARAATFESVGDWRDVDDDLVMHALTGAGLFGRCTSWSPNEPRRIPLQYGGHVLVDGHNATMRRFVRQAEPRQLSTPVILIVGSSMSSGKTTVAKIAIRQLRSEGRKIVGVKLTGAARMADTLAMLDAGADEVFDFVDAGLPSTVVNEPLFRDATLNLLSRIEDLNADVIVAEIGASPLEPYNGKTAMDLLKPAVVSTVLCATDPYAVVGAVKAFHVEPDFVSGRAAGNEAGRTLVERLSGLRTLDVLDPGSQVALREHLLGALASREVA